MSRTRVGLALSGAALLLACGGVAAAATGAPSAGPALGSSTAASSPTPSVSPTSDDEDKQGDDAGEDEGDDQGEDQEQDGSGDDSGEAGDTRTGGVGPDASGPAHHGLCTAWSHVKDAPGKAAQSTAFRNVQEVDCSDVVTKPKGTGDADEGADSGKGSKPSKSS